ncbi:MAG: DUF2779 domain-containing protein [Eggerthellaceae bacterium]|nr:DUF2779 domain-containing protein [Eggerthellaceae bacterium]
MYLSKSRYTSGVQCPKMLWMKQHMPEVYDPSVENQEAFRNGSMVGDLAMGYYGPYAEVPFVEGQLQEMIDETRRLLAAGTPVICEASFSFDGNFCSADILRTEADGVHLVEVKSSTHLNPIYLHDMAYQTWVLTACGLKVKSVSLMHINSGYVRSGDLDLQQLFTVEDCTAEVMAMLPDVGARIANLKAVADADEEPDIPFGPQCKDPYPCGFAGWCWREVPHPGVFDLCGIRSDRAFKLMEQGIVCFEDVDAAKVRLTPRQAVQVRAELEDVCALAKPGELQRFLDTLRWPLYFLDFETWQPAVPPFDGVRPYQQIPTQYSLHVRQIPDGPLEHREFLAEAGTDPRRAVAEHLVADIPADACTLAFNKSFEQGRIAELAKAFPDLAEHLMGIRDNMVDLIDPFKSGACYFRAMGGSNSIKAVLPAMFPDDAELDYHALEGVHNGTEAMTAFADLANMAPEEAARTREQLLRYCELDTLAMVRVLEKLGEMVPEARVELARFPGGF